MNNAKALKGYRVVELATFVAAPACGRLLADWGAEVIKVEPAGGDAWRCFGPSVSMTATDDENPAWELYNTNKQGIVVDLKTVEGQKIFHELLSTADIFLANNRAEALEKLQLDYDSLKAQYPQLIYAWVTGFGEKGPDVNQPGFDVVAYWSRSGFLVDLVRPGEYPVYGPAGFGDLTVAMTLYAGICTALLNRTRTGKGEKVCVSLYGAAIWFAGAIITSVQDRYGNKYPKERLEGNPLAIPYLCQDNEWIMLSILEYDRHYATFCQAIGREDLVGDERFNKRANMMKNKAELILTLEETFRGKNQQEWLTILRAADVVHDKLRHFKDVLTDEQAWANEYLCNHTFANGQTAIFPCTPIKTTEESPLSYGKAPALGEHTELVLKQLGYSDGAIEDMRINQIVKG